MKHEIYPKALFRIPQFSLDATLKESWEELKKSICLASKDFYQTIEHVDAEALGQLPAQVQYTIWKYFNRAKYRCTPFGSFSGIALVPVRPTSDDNSILVSNSQQLHAFVDWKEKDLNAENKKLQSNTLLISNSSYYTTGNSIRYLCSLNGIFQLMEAESSPIIVDILNACSSRISYEALQQRMRLKYPYNSNIPALVKQLVSAQLLLSDKQPNIIGQDYFSRLNLKSPGDNAPYIIAQRDVLAGVLDKKDFKHLDSLIALLSSIAPSSSQSALDDFKARFINKFESAEVPLQLALDPQLGIGYEELAFPYANDAIPDELLPVAALKQPQSAYNELRTTLTRAMIENQSRSKNIDLSELTLPMKTDPLPTANTFSLIGKVAAKMVFVEKIGGITANALLGRFTHAGNEFLDTCRDIAAIEQQANPEVAFFDVAYMAEPKVDNVNRRKAIYRYQLSLLNYDTCCEPLGLNDLMVRVANNEVMLRSITLNKRVIPRIASAYNSRRSDLAVFRFLSDLQYQKLQGSLSFDLEAIVPSLTFYPRVTYHNFIVSPARWKLKYALLSPYGNNIKEYLCKLGVSRYFRTGKGDMTLCFDKENPDDLAALLIELKREKELMLQEEFIDTKCNVFCAGGKQPYNHQFILSLSRGQLLFPDTPTRNLSPQKSRNVFLPGGDWVYFEIYCHPVDIDPILPEIFQFLKKWKRQIVCWFFIRYNENGNHLRLRVKLRDRNQIGLFIIGLSEIISQKIKSGSVSDFKLCTYRPETHRYGGPQMQWVEQHFSVDSLYVVNLLRHCYPPLIKYRICSILFEAIGESGLFSLTEWQTLLKSISTNFNREHLLEASKFRVLNSEYKRYKSTIGPRQTIKEQRLFKNFVGSLIATVGLYEKGRQQTIFADLIHMHINRLFSEYQRTHEMMVYYFQYKDLCTRQALRVLEQRA